jgi:uncharacterized protein (TIGR03663 family)
MELLIGRVRRLAPWMALVALSLALHLWQLGDRSFHHDEAIHAQGAYQLLESGSYRYDPTYHGPLLYMLGAAVFAVMGDSDFTARLPIALAAVAMIAVAWSARRPLGPRAAWWTALLATISPIWLFYGRFLRMDILEALTASCAFLAAWRAARGSRRAWAWVGVWTGLAFATKENAFVTAALVGGVAVVLLLSGGLRRAWGSALDWVVRHRWGLLSAVAAAVLVTVPLFTVGFKHPGDWFFPYRAISYWWGQHSIERVAGPPWYHLPRLALYEFLPIAAGLVWAVRRGRRMLTVERALLVFALASVAMYAYLGEKVPWLGVHQVWAFLPLAGLQLARTFGPRGRWWSRALAAAALAATLVTTVVANFVLDEISPNLDRVEALVYVQTCPEIKAVVEEGLRLTADGRSPPIAVQGEAGWPFTWYWRSQSVWWSAPNRGQRPPLVLCDVESEREIRRALGPGYTSERVPLRAWWVMEDWKPSLRDVADYVLTRRPWGFVGSTDIMVLRETEEVEVSSVETTVPEPLGELFDADSATLVGDGWLIEPRGLAVGPDGTLAVADVAANEISFYRRNGSARELTIPEQLNQPEGVAWTPDGVLVVADTWNHRVLLFSPETETARPLPEPEEGWYGPRAVAVAPDGTVAVSDTGHKRVVLYGFAGGAPQASVIGREGAGAGELSEPVGLTWLDNQRLLVCDTGNHRLQVLDRDGRALEVVKLSEAWADFYSRPQALALAPGRWLVTDVPARALWVVDNGAARRVDLGPYGITPSGLARGAGAVYLADLGGRVWVLGERPLEVR